MSLKLLQKSIKKAAEATDDLIGNKIADATNEPSKFKTRNWVEINDESRRTYNVSSQISLTLR